MSNDHDDHAEHPDDVQPNVRKTYKLYVGGQFVRSESGQVARQLDARGGFFANASKASRKDLRDAVKSARGAFGGWAARSAFNRGQILYRCAEMLAGRRSQFEQLLVELCGRDREAAAREVAVSIERVFWYAGFCDKFAQVLGGVNPIASPYSNFTFNEPCGVVAVLAPRGGGLIGLVSALFPVLAGGNAAVLVVDHDLPVVALEFAEVLATSDVPAGVVHVLAGEFAELAPHAADHMDVDALALFGGDDTLRTDLVRRAASNIKRVAEFEERSIDAWLARDAQSGYWIEKFVEWKTSWHPIGV
jgi:acyl-CoA reductase-like NAD-dependent aldehyde dehydrogenase